MAAGTDSEGNGSGALQAALDAVGDLVAVLDPETGRYVACNSRVCDLFGRSREEILQARVGDHSPGPTPEMRRQALDALRTAPDGPLALEWPVRSGSGVVVPLRPMVTRVRTPHGEQVVLVAKSPGGDRQVGPEEPGPRERLEILQRLSMVSMVGAGIVHDLNNQAAILVGQLDLLQRDADLPEPVRARLGGLASVAMDQARLVGQLIRLARGDDGQRVPVDVNALVEEAARMAGDVLPGAISWWTELDPDLPPVEALAGELRQVVLNLVFNARDAMPEGGRLGIRTTTARRRPVRASGIEGSEPREFVRLTVLDTGVGIPRRHWETVFEPFYTTKKADAGMGLGLAVVRDIVARHGGFVELHSEVGKGTTVDIYLPAAGPQEPPRGRQPVGPESGRAGT